MNRLPAVICFLVILFVDTNGLQCLSCGTAPNCDVYSASTVTCPNNTFPAMNYCSVVQASNSLQRGCAYADFCQIYENNTSVMCNLCGSNKCNGGDTPGVSWILFGVVLLLVKIFGV